MHVRELPDGIYQNFRTVLINVGGKAAERAAEVPWGEQKSCNTPSARQKHRHGKA